MRPRNAFDSVQVSGILKDVLSDGKRRLDIMLSSVNEEVRPATKASRDPDSRQRNASILERAVTGKKRTGHPPALDHTQRVELIRTPDVILPSQSCKKDGVRVGQQHLVDNLTIPDLARLPVGLVDLGHTTAEQDEKATRLDEVRLEHLHWRLLYKRIKSAQPPRHRLELEQGKGVLERRGTSQERPLRRFGSTRRGCNDARG